MVKAFQFEHGGRTFKCRSEKRSGDRPESWWWFDVTGDGQRYAPFLAASGDTEAKVRERIIAFYTNLLERRAMPAAPRGPWKRRGDQEAPAKS